jgi:hypothetical protein
MESILQSLSENNIKARLEALPRLEQAVQNKELDTVDAAPAISLLAACLTDNNFRVCQGALTVIGLLVEQLGDDFRQYTSTIMPGVVEKLGDAKAPVCAAAVEIIDGLVGIVGPAEMYDSLVSSFMHKNWRVRQQLVLLFNEHLTSVDLRSLPVTELIPTILQLLNDIRPDVREAAIECIVELYVSPASA